MVSEVKFGVNRMEGDRAVATGESMSLATGLVVRSIGYKSVAIPGVPFDEGRSIVPNSEGRVIGGAGLKDDAVGGLGKGEGGDILGWMRNVITCHTHPSSPFPHMLFGRLSLGYMWQDG